MNTLNNTNNILQKTEQQKKIYPVKEYLIKYSNLVKFNEKENAGKQLNKQEQTKQRRIYELRDKVFSNINSQLRRYYEVLTDEDYRIAGMPEISRGISGWIEDKIWGLLVLVGEPEKDGNLYIWKKTSGGFWKAEE